MNTIIINKIKQKQHFKFKLFKKLIVVVKYQFYM